MVQVRRAASGGTVPRARRRSPAGILLCAARRLCCSAHRPSWHAGGLEVDAARRHPPRHRLRPDRERARGDRRRRGAAGRCDPRGRRPGHRRTAASPPSCSTASSAPRTGSSWFATYVEAIRQLAAYAERMSAAGALRRDRGAAGAHRARRIPRADARRHSDEPGRDGAPGRSRACRSQQVGERVSPAVEELIATGNTAENRARLVALMREHHGATVGDCGLDETLEAIRDEMRKFAESEVVPHAHEWHLTNSYIPLEVVAHMSELGVFGLTIPEEYGGMGLGKESMCVVSEELSRGYIGVGSLGTRSEIAAELILGGGTDAQKTASGCRRSHPARCCRPRCSPSRTPAPTSPRSRRARCKRGRRLQGLRQQDLDHPSGARRPDDAAGAHRSEGAGLSRAFDAARREAARHRRGSVSRRPACRAARSRCSAIAA